MKLHQFNTATGLVFVNPLQVLTVKPAENAEHATITLANGADIEVVALASDAAQQLSLASRDAN